MSDRSYINAITEADVSIALEQVLVAPVGTAWTAGRIDVTSPPVGFYHLGAVQEDTPQLSVNKGLYQLRTGLPRALRYQAVIDLAGEFQFVLHSVRNSRVFHTLGGQPMYHVANTLAATWATVTSVVGRFELTVSSPSLAQGLAVGQMLVTDTTPNITTTRNEAFITSFTTSATSSLSTVYVAGPHGFATTPVVGAPIYAVGVDRYPMGSTELPFFRMLGVADFLNGAQIIHDFQKVAPRGQFVEALRNGQDARVPGMFDLYGYTVSTPYGTSNVLVVAERLYFPPTSPGL